MYISLVYFLFRHTPTHMYRHLRHAEPNFIGKRFKKSFYPRHTLENRKFRDMNPTTNHDRHYLTSIESKVHKS